MFKRLEADWYYQSAGHGNDLAPVVNMTRSGPPRFLRCTSTVGLLVATTFLPQSAHGQPAAGTPHQVPAGLAVQVALDRAGFSPGVIDGAPGRTTRAALQRFQEAKGLTPSGAMDDATRQALPADASLVDYTLTAEDLAGPFLDRIPDDMMEKRTLEVLAYTSPAEMLAERFHTTSRLLARLNPRLTWKAGTMMRVPNVEPCVVPATTETRQVNPPEAEGVAEVHVSKAAGALTVKGVDGKVLFSAPVTSGSDHDPLPLGTWKVTAVYLRPVFHYSPDLFWDADPSHAKARLPAGPNNPVGLVWIDLDKEHYGLHGTPEPDRVGVTQSHGCVRLTNWDALRVAALVKTGTPVIFEP
ncbi:L,D-transpeptidase family protein [Luteitalea pratensis]|uniref:L,D-transpeptidase family protein n=1 Tax=Luteitalea pratensis TaxID=1855912 RepID=UPI001F44449B|nr:L,D-transpeptidase family protein [Luteitalea pratensis]